MGSKKSKPSVEDVCQNICGSGGEPELDPSDEQHASTGDTHNNKPQNTNKDTKVKPQSVTNEAMAQLKDENKNNNDCILKPS